MPGIDLAEFAQIGKQERSRRGPDTGNGSQDIELAFQIAMAGDHTLDLFLKHRFVALAHGDPGFYLPYRDGMIARMQPPFEIANLFQDLPPRRIQAAQMLGLHAWRGGRSGFHAFRKKRQGLRIDGVGLCQLADAAGKLAGAERVYYGDGNPGIVEQGMSEAVIGTGCLHRHEFDALLGQLAGEGLYGGSAIF